MLKDPDLLVKGEDGVTLAAIDGGTPAGKTMRASAEHILRSLGRKADAAITVADATATSVFFAQARLNGDGIVPPEAITDLAGRGLDLDQPVQLANEFASIVDGSPYHLSPADDSDPEPYAHLGERWPLRRLVHAMIVRSSNLATNLVIALADPGAMQRACEALGTRATAVRRGVEDGKAFATGRNNVTTADDLATLLVALANDTAASPAACAAMRTILAAQEFNELIPAGLPPGTKVAHKTGQITAHRHDAAIVYPAAGSPYVLVVLTKRWADAAESAAVHAAR